MLSTKNETSFKNIILIYLKWWYIFLIQRNSFYQPTKNQSTSIRRKDLVHQRWLSYFMVLLIYIVPSKMTSKN